MSAGAYAVRSVANSYGSATFEEARHRAVDFFRVVCRAMPDVLSRFNLEEVTTIMDLRRKAALEFRKHAHVTNPKVIDMLVYKGKEELENLMSHSKQRHHVLSKYIVGPELSIQPNKMGIADHGESDFLKKFYRGNRF